jgi:hypothetical protein
MQIDLTQAELAELLQETERAHGEYERELGQRDEDWPTWYAGYILDRLAERSGKAPCAPRRLKAAAPDLDASATASSMGSPSASPKVSPAAKLSPAP